MQDAPGDRGDTGRSRWIAGGGTLYFEIFAVALATLLLEISYTRVFSFKLYYFFTYFIIGIGLLGLGAGGVLVAVSRRLRDADPERLIPWLCAAGAAAVTLGYAVVAPMPLNVAQMAENPAEAAKLLYLALLLVVPFLTSGVIITTILAGAGERVNRLYGADLIGAALGCAAAIPLLGWLAPPGCVLLSAAILAAGGLRLALRRGWGGRLAVGALGLAAFAAMPGIHPLLRPDVGRGYHRALEHDLIRETRWSPVFRVDVVDCWKELNCRDVLLLLHDGAVGSVLTRFDGDFSRLTRFDRDPRRLPFRVVPDDPRVLIIGSAGGHEILASLHFGAAEVEGVELNPSTVELLTDTYARYTGHLHEDPRVAIVNGEGRSFLRRGDRRYDLIWFVAPDSYAAMNASSSAGFVLTESYLYTVEAIRQSLTRLSDGGVICAQFGELHLDEKPNRTTRYLATARAALAELGIERFSDHVLVASSKGLLGLSEVTILVSRTPFTTEQVRAFRAGIGEVRRGALRHAPGVASARADPIVHLPDDRVERWLGDHPYLVGPVRDDAPFFWHFARFTDALRRPLGLRGYVVDYEDAIGEQVLMALLAVAGLVAASLLLLPFVAIREVFASLPHKPAVMAYFAALGAGFMALEVALIQKLTLFLGYPTYSLSVTLFGLLVFSGLGSLASDRLPRVRRTALLTLFAALAVLVLAHRWGTPWLVEHFVGAPLAVRIGLALALIAPLGLCLGAFMPLGLRTVSVLSAHPREYVAWAWAINGFFSVLSSVLATILAMTFGFDWLMLGALGVYALGIAAFARTPEAVPS